MRITVNHFDCINDQCQVEFTSDFGSAYGKWEGDSPTKGADYEVEIDLPSIGSIRVELADASDLSPSIRTEGTGTTIVVGTLIHDEGGGASVRLGDDILLLEDNLSFIKSGAVVRLISPSITLFPVIL